MIEIDNIANPSTKWNEMVDKYFTRAKSTIDVCQIYGALKQLLDMLVIDNCPSLPDKYCLLLLSNMINNELLQELKEDVMDMRQYFYDLLDEIIMS